MKKSYKYILLAVLSLSTLGLSTILAPSSADCEVYNPQGKLADIETEINFWESKLDVDPTSVVFKNMLSNAYSTKFSADGTILSLKKAENLLRESLSQAPENCGTLRSLAHNYISQHRFKEAKDLIEKAYAIGEDKDFSRLMLFDVSLELGEDDRAQELLNKISNKKDFNFYIRKAKLQDGADNLEGAISSLEIAKEIAEKSKNTNQLQWIYSNLADYYGHAGKIEKSKKHFKMALEINPADWYSYKGLAYIKWSHEEDEICPLFMVNDIEEYYEGLSIAFLKADILEVQGEKEKAKSLRAKTIEEAMAPEYGDMYNIPLFEYAKEQGDIVKAKQLVEKELKVRETPHSYAMKATIEFEEGREDLALSIIEEKVINKTFEPSTYLTILPIVQGNMNNYSLIFNDLREARFELGPLAIQQIAEES